MESSGISSDKKRNAYYLKKYGITLEQYNQMLEAQNYSCAICKKHESEFKARLAVDHNHKTGQVRGLLCYRDNKYLIGRLNNKTVTDAYNYIIKYEGTYNGLLSETPDADSKNLQRNPKRSRRSLRKTKK